MSLDAVIREKLDAAREHTRAIQERFGAWFLDHLITFSKAIWHIASFIIFLFLTTLCPYFAWASLGEQLFRFSPILFLQIFGVLIVVAPILFVIVHLFLTLRKASSDELSAAAVGPEDLQLPQQQNGPLSIWSHVESIAVSLQRMIHLLLSLFRGERTGRLAYYSIFFVGAILITVAMLTTSWGNPLAETYFGALNVWIIGRVVSIPGWLISNVTTLVKGINFEMNTEVLSKVLGLSHTEFVPSAKLLFWSIWSVILIATVLVCTDAIGPQKRWKRWTWAGIGIATLLILLWAYVT